MEHRPYPKIATRSALELGGPWIATEKIHGANLLGASSDEVLLRLLDEVEFPRSVNEALAVLDAMEPNRFAAVQRRIAEVRESLQKD